MSKEITLTVVTEAGITWITSISLIFSVLLFISLCSCCCYCCWCCLSPGPPKPRKRPPPPHVKPRTLCPSPEGPNLCNDLNSTPTAITVQSYYTAPPVTPTLNQKWFLKIFLPFMWSLGFLLISRYGYLSLKGKISIHFYYFISFIYLRNEPLW